MVLYFLGFFISVLILFKGLNMTFAYGHLGLKKNVFSLAMIFVGSFCGIILLVGVVDKMHKDREGEENIMAYLTNYYQVNHPASLTITELSNEDLYKIKLLSGKQEIIKLKISEHEVTGIEVIDSSENLKKPS